MSRTQTIVLMKLLLSVALCQTTIVYQSTGSTTLVEATGSDGATVQYRHTNGNDIHCSRYPQSSTNAAAQNKFYEDLYPYRTWPVGNGRLLYCCDPLVGNCHLAPSPYNVRVRIVDRTPPKFTIDPVYNVNTNSNSGAVVVFPDSFKPVDIVDPNPVTDCTPLKSGSTFPVGTTRVSCTSTDFSGNTGNVQFDVKVTKV